MVGPRACMYVCGFRRLLISHQLSGPRYEVDSQRGFNALSKHCHKKG